MFCRSFLTQYMTNRGQEKTMLQCTKQEMPKQNIFTFQENKTQDSFQNLILQFTRDQRKPLQQIRSRSLNNVCTHRKHFEDLQPIRSPAFLGFVYWQRKVNIPGILREEQHQKDSPVGKKAVITSHSTLLYSRKQ